MEREIHHEARIFDQRAVLENGSRREHCTVTCVTLAAASGLSF